MFSCKFCEIFKNAFLIEHLQWFKNKVLILTFDVSEELETWRNSVIWKSFAFVSQFVLKTQKLLSK